ncbi:MAG: hypothetical protein ABSF54_12905 [Bryobacteraceae bacterium]
MTGPVAAAAAEALGDSVVILLNDLSASDTAKLIDLIGRPLPAQDSARVQDLLRTFFSAAAEGDLDSALSALSAIVALDPSRPEILRTDPAVESIRASVDQFLDRYATVARLDAEGRLEQAGQQAGSSAPDRLNGWDMRPATMLLIANRIFDSGGLANYVRAAELAQVVIDGSRWAPDVVNLPVAALEWARITSHDAAKQPGGGASLAKWRASGRMAARLRYLWLRAPLLILLLAWLLLGIAGGFGSLLWRRFWPDTWPGSLVEMAFDVWGSGFLILVALGFFAHVRKVRF